jgi:hypothetical protein
VWAAQGSSTKCSGCSSTLIDNDERTFAFAATKIVPFYSLPTAGVRIASSVGSSPKFWFEVTEGGKTSIFNQNGPGFQLQTQVLLSSTTCQSSDGLLFRVDIAVSTARQLARYVSNHWVLLRCAKVFHHPVSSSKERSTPRNSTKMHQEVRLPPSRRLSTRQRRRRIQRMIFTPSHSICLPPPSILVGSSMSLRRSTDKMSLIPHILVLASDHPITMGS